ncbi:hypothetical protein DAMA08_013560 [Martiniozyma asiatica (nom. inval.)]|nr:hypothetical protein DAMA08_013560 [Martiniozyma asiatica]
MTTLLAQLDTALATEGWARAMDESSNEFYYYNDVQSSWEVPQAVLAGLSALIGKDAHTLTKEIEIALADEANNSETTAAVQVDGKDEDVEGEKVNAHSDADDDDDDHHQTQIGSSGVKMNDLIDLPTATSTFVHLEAQTTKEPKEIFLKFLGSLNMEPNWTFKTFVKNASKDPRYWIVDSLTRRQLFEAVLVQTIDERRSVSEASAANPLESKEKDSLKEHLLNTSNAELLGTRFLDQLPQLQVLCPHLTKLDILKVYKDATNSKYEQLELQIKSVELKNYRQDRKARDAFRDILRLLMIEKKGPKEKGEISYAKFIQLIKGYPNGEAAMVELCGRKGSTLIDYWWDLVDLISEGENNLKRVHLNEEGDAGSLHKQRKIGK